MSTKFSAQTAMDPIMKALLHNPTLLTTTHMALNFTTQNPGFSETAMTPSKSYSNSRSSSNCSVSTGTCKLPQLARSTSASVAKKGQGNDESLFHNKATVPICTIPGHPVKSIQKFSIFEQLDTKDTGQTSDWQLPTLRLPFKRRSQSNPERSQQAIDASTHIAPPSWDRPKVSTSIQRGNYPIEFPSNPNQVVYGYSMSPHPERNGGFRRAHCPIGDQYRALDTCFPAL